jgi:hypothetical protein
MVGPLSAVVALRDAAFSSTARSVLACVAGPASDRRPRLLGCPVKCVQEPNKAVSDQTCRSYWSSRQVAHFPRRPAPQTPRQTAALKA